MDGGLTSCPISPTLQLSELKQELSALRVAKVTGGAPNKLAKIKVSGIACRGLLYPPIALVGPPHLSAPVLQVVRKGIARVLTVISQTQRQALKKEYEGKKYLPIDLRAKKTRAIRRRLTKNQRTAKLEKQKKRESAFPLRKYAVKA